MFQQLLVTSITIIIVIINSTTSHAMETV